MFQFGMDKRTIYMIMAALVIMSLGKYLNNRLIIGKRAVYVKR